MSQPSGRDQTSFEALLDLANRFHYGPDPETARIEFGLALYTFGYTGQAAALLDRAGATIDANPNALWTLAFAWLQEDEPDRARSALERAEAVQPFGGYQSLIAARIELAAGDMAAALARLAALDQADPQVQQLSTEVRAWRDEFDGVVETLLKTDIASADGISVACWWSLIRRWARSDLMRQLRVVSETQHWPRQRHTVALSDETVAALKFVDSAAIARAVQVNAVTLRAGLMDYSSAATCAVAAFSVPQVADHPVLLSYLRFLAPMAEECTGTRLRALQEHCAAVKLAAAAVQPFSHSPPRPLTGRRLRLGVLTRWYASENHFILLAHRDRQLLDVVGFVVNDVTGAAPAALARESECYDVVHAVAGLDDATIARLIHEAQIDILIDVTGLGSAEREGIAAWRPAPIQVVWTTKLATTGMPQIDWYLADRALVPPEHDQHFTERVWRYDTVVTPWKSTHSDIWAGPPPCQSTNCITFGSPASLFKVSDRSISLWADVLDAVPGSRFVYAAPSHQTENILWLYDRFVRLGFNPERLMLLSSDTGVDMLRLLNHVDIALDSAPFGCNRTALECLAMGVPLLTQWGERLTSRYTASQLAALGLDDWIARDRADFVRRAVALAADRSRLAHWRRVLPDRVASAPMLDPAHAMRTLETALFGMWDEYVARCGGEG